MNVKNDLQGLQEIFSSREVTRSRSGEAPPATDLTADTRDEATLTSAATLAAQTAAGSDVRLEKVAEVQEALAEGRYTVPSTEVAGKLIDQMLRK
jgi:negative regulator of flagellin synthesis FlgM